MASLDCDVVVMGGGPAGSTVGHLLARAGRRAIVLERDRFPRFHIGESLLPVNVPLFEELGVVDELERARCTPKYGVQVVAGSSCAENKVYFREGFVPCPPKAYQVVRATFDDILLRACARAGAEVLEGHEALDATREAGRWRVRVRDPEGQERCIEASYLVDATGRDTFLARQRRNKQMAAGHRRATVYAHYRGVARDPGIDAGNTVLVVLRDGWFWLIPVSEDVMSIGLVVQGKALRGVGGTPEEILEQAIQHCPEVARRAAAATRVTPVYTTSNYSYRCDDQATEGALAAGDARAFIDPIFSSGVWLAMHGGAEAARTLNGCLASPSSAGRLLARYESSQRRIHRHYWRMIDAFYSPEFLDIFLQPTDRLSLRAAMNSVFAGMGPGGPGLRTRMRIFYLVLRLQRLLRLREPLPLGRIFAQPAAA